MFPLQVYWANRQRDSSCSSKGRNHIFAAFLPRLSDAGTFLLKRLLHMGIPRSISKNGTTKNNHFSEWVSHKSCLPFSEPRPECLSLQFAPQLPQGSRCRVYDRGIRILPGCCQSRDSTVCGRAQIA